MILFFRGKAATGKSSLANLIQQKVGYDIISKDSIFDELLIQGLDWDNANSITYNELANKIQNFHDSNNNVILDIGLSHTPSFVHFLSKMNLNKNNIKQFLFVCSEDDLWEARILKRINSPEGPNQSMKSVEEAKNHYGKYTIEKLQEESEVDSALSLTVMFKEIKSNAPDYFK